MAQLIGVNPTHVSTPFKLHMMRMKILREEAITVKVKVKVNVAICRRCEQEIVVEAYIREGAS